MALFRPYTLPWIHIPYLESIITIYYDTPLVPIAIVGIVGITIEIRHMVPEFAL